MNKAKKILVIDDDFEIREIISLILAEEGYEISALDNGRDVDSEIIRSHPDVILLDVMLGGIDGRDVCAHLKAESCTSGIMVIMISATHCCPGPGEKCYGADDYLPKPFDIFDLIRKVKMHSAA